MPVFSNMVTRIYKGKKHSTKEYPMLENKREHYLFFLRKKESIIIISIAIFFGRTLARIVASNILMSNTLTKTR